MVELRHLEDRLKALGGPIAAEHLGPLEEVRIKYEAALAMRRNALIDLGLGAKRQLRNLAREVWVEAYVANQGAVREAYPRDRRMQDLFFDDVRTARTESGDAEGGDGTRPAKTAAGG